NCFEAPWPVDFDSAITSPSEERIEPRLICWAANSGRLLTVSSLRLSASNTDQYDVKPTSTAKQTVMKAKSLIIWAFIPKLPRWRCGRLPGPHGGPGRRPAATVPAG